VTTDELKRQAAARALEHVRDGMKLGLGTGSTAKHFVELLGERVRAGLDVVGVPTSEATRADAERCGIRLTTLDDIDRLDLTVDGADEIGPGLSLIKGGGAALLREKLVWEASNRCLVIADAAKRVETLGKFALPIEVIAFGHKQTANRISDVLSEHDIAMMPKLRMKDGAPVKTDGGNLIYDAACGAIEHPASLAEALKSLTGVVDHGLFLDLADEALIGTDAGVKAETP
jgi:ribose 5-phosphate isomerase A